MTIECAMLGLIQRAPLSGYDLKKAMQDDPAMPWSGNNNQIYRALSAMHQDGLLESRLIHQDALPSRKVYALTDAGREQLIEWLREPPEMLEPRKPFLAQLALASVLPADEVDGLIAGYAQQIRAQLDRCPPAPDIPQGDYAAALRALVQDNLRANYQAELDWTDRARAGLVAYVRAHGAARAASIREERKTMQYAVMAYNGQHYLSYQPPQARPQALDPTQFVGDCLNENTTRVLIYASALPEAFFNLRTGMAGEVMQKLGQYHVKAALVLNYPDIQGRFVDLMAELNRGNMFNTFMDAKSAERWLTWEEE